MSAQSNASRGGVAFSGARALVVGATGTLGSALATELSSQGVELALSGRDAERLNTLAQEVGAISALPADLAEPSEAARIVEVGSAALGGLDLLVFAAGAVAFGPARELSSEVLAHLLRVNLEAPILATGAALRQMEPGGVIVNLSAIVAEMPTAGLAAYSAAKAGLTAFDAAVAREARRDGIRVLDVRPPHLATGMEQRAIAGAPPALPAGREPDLLVDLIMDALADPRARTVRWPKPSPAAA
jgi:short-subunit dehydrogenase